MWQKKSAIHASIVGPVLLRCGCLTKKLFPLVLGWIETTLEAQQPKSDMGSGKIITSTGICSHFLWQIAACHWVWQLENGSVSVYRQCLGPKPTVVSIFCFRHCLRTISAKLLEIGTATVPCLQVLNCTYKVSIYGKQLFYSGFWNMSLV